MATRLYLHSTDDEFVSGYRSLSDTPGSGISVATVSTVASGTDIQWTDIEGGSVLAWASPPSPVGGWTLAGSISFNIWADESSPSANCKMRARVYRRDTSGVEHEIGVGPFDDNVEIGITPGVMTWNPTTLGETFAEDERLVVKFYITNNGTMGGGFFCELNHDGATGGVNGDSWIEIPEDVTFKPDSADTTEDVGQTVLVVIGQTSVGEFVDDVGQVILAVLGETDTTGEDELNRGTVVLVVTGRTDSAQRTDNRGQVVLVVTGQTSAATFTENVGTVIVSSDGQSDSLGTTDATEIQSDLHSSTKRIWTEVSAVPPDGSGRYRTVNVRGTGTFGGVPIRPGTSQTLMVLPFFNSGFSVEQGGIWYGGTSVTFNGISGVGADFIEIEGRIQQTHDGSGNLIEQWREYRAVLELYGIGTHRFYGDWTGHVQDFPVNEHEPNVNLLSQIAGFWGVDCVQKYYEIHGNENLTEKSYIELFVLSGSVTVQMPIIFGGVVEEVITLTATGQFELTPQDLSDAVNASYGQGLFFSRLCPGFDLRCSAQQGRDELRCKRGGFSSSDGSVELQGDGHEASMSCGSTFVGNPPTSHYYKIIPPSGNVVSYPSWAIKLVPKGYAYEDSANVAMEVDWAIAGQYRDLSGLLHSYPTINLSGTSPTPVRYPTSNFLQSFGTFVTDGFVSEYNVGDFFVQNYPGISNPPGVSATGLVNEPFPLFAPDISSQAGTLSDGRVNASNVAYTYSLNADKTWANSHPSYIDSYHHPFWARNGDQSVIRTLKNLQCLLGPRWFQGSLQFPSTYPFEVMNDQDKWFEESNCNISEVSGRVQFEATAANAVVRTINDSGVRLYSLKPFSFRYLQLRIKSDTPSSNFRFYVGAFQNGVTPIFAKYRWDLSISAADTYEDIVIDLAQPDYVGKIVSGVGSWEAADREYHGEEIFWPNGQPVWLYFETEATYLVFHLQGYVDDTGTRSEPLLFHPLDGKGGYGESLETYEPDFVYSVGGEMNMRLVVNGSRMFTTVPSQDQFGTVPFSTLWSQLISAISASPANDTGIVVQASTDSRKSRPWVFNSELQEAHEGEGFGLPVTLDTPLLRYAQQIGPFPHGYYGMGSAWDRGPYTSELEFVTEWIFGGEATGIVPGYTAGESLELRDNDTETVIDTADPDDDGYFRLFAKYGVKKPKDNIDSSKEYTETFVPLGGPPPEYSISYTTLGKSLNSYWLWGDELTDIDGDGYAKSPDWNDTQNRNERLDVPILDRYQTWLILPFEDVFVGTDITSTISGIHRVYKKGTVLWYGKNMARGKESAWQDQEIQSNLDGDAIPTITTDFRENGDVLIVGYHTSLAAHVIRSETLGEGWDHLAIIEGRKWPRVAVTLEAIWVAVMNESDLEIYKLGNWPAELVTTISDVDEPTLVGFSSDFHNRHILTYMSGGVFVQRANRGTEIGDPEVISGSSGRKNLVAVYPWFGYPYGRHFFWDPTDLVVARTLGTLIGETETDGSIDASGPVQFIGACIDNHGTWWVIGQLSNETLELFKSTDGGTTFEAVT